jgi:hypothetical protein
MTNPLAIVEIPISDILKLMYEEATAEQQAFVVGFLGNFAPSADCEQSVSSLRGNITGFSCFCPLRPILNRNHSPCFNSVG